MTGQVTLGARLLFTIQDASTRALVGDWTDMPVAMRLAFAYRERTGGCELRDHGFRVEFP